MSSSARRKKFRSVPPPPSAPVPPAPFLPLLPTGTASLVCGGGPSNAIRTEVDTCVVVILDERSAPGQRYFEDVKTALPDMRITDDLREVEAFIRSVKGSDYFLEGGR